MKKIMILILVLILLFSTLTFVSSKPINSYKDNNESNLDNNLIQNIDQKIQIKNNDINPKPIQSRSLAESPWPMFRQNLNHTGLSPYNTSYNNGTIIWNFTTGDYIYSSPAIDSNGTIYVGSSDGDLYAIYPNGTKKWNIDLGWAISSSPAIGSNGTIYVGSSNNYLYAINPDGTIKWNFFANFGIYYCSPAISSNGTVYIGAYDNKLYAIDPNGTEVWNFLTGDLVRSSPAISSNGTVYFGSGDGYLYALNPNGTKKWSYSFGGEVFSSPAIGSDGTIYTGVSDLYAINPNGTKKWSYLIGLAIASSPAIDADGIIYVGNVDNNLYAIYPNGTKKWNFLTGGDVRSSPAIGSDGTIYVGSDDGNLYAINPDGTQKWNITTGNWFRSSPAIGSEGTIYIGCWDSKLYAIGMPMILSSKDIDPLFGFTDTYFHYTLNYLHIDNKPPIYLNVSINGNNYNMLETDSTDTNYSDGKDYYFKITNLNVGVHNYKFYVSDGDYNKFTELLIGPYVNNTSPNIITPDNLTAIEDTYYEVIYQYEDIDLANVGQTGTWNYSTNATWLNFNPTTAMLYGTPSNNDVGEYWVNISINDTIDIDFTNFTLTVLNENDDPIIETTNVEVTYEDELYEVDYNASDIDSLISNQMWSLSTNATLWLNIDIVTGIISGIPTNDDVGSYWVNISVDDGDTGLAFTNYTLIVLNVNDPPIITTEDVLEAPVNVLYEVDYNATDIDSSISQLKWSLFTNATNWLEIDYDTGILSGTPSINDLGWYNVNVTLKDLDGGQAWREFILVVTPIEEPEPDNDPPVITTIDKVSITAGESYNVIYEATDDRTPIDSLIWSSNYNASWLSFNKLTISLSGNPTLSHVGWYWVNVTVNDGEGGFDSHNFTLRVYATGNQPPKITTDDKFYAVVNEFYSVDYNATDDRTPIDYLQWSLKTNASWLIFDPKTGILNGTPTLDDVGSYWVMVLVFDGENGFDFHNFTLRVTKEPIITWPPELSNPSMTPSSGDTEAMFTFSVDYSHREGDLPDSIQVVIDGNAYNMEATNGHYEYSTKLSEGNHIYYFSTTLGEFTIETEYLTTPYIEKAEEQPEDGDGDEDNTMLYVGSGIVVIIIIVVLILLFIFLKKKEGEEEEAPVEETPPPPPEEVLPEVPPEQPPTPEVPPEQVPTPETPPPEEPQVPEVSPEQPPPPETPTPEVIPQVPQPQVEPAPQPPPKPQVAEQPVPTPQVEPQEPQGQAPVPKVKEPTIKAPEEDVEE